jgi:ATP-dependent Lhr-like helicase
MRKTLGTGQLLVISGTDPLNLAGILTPGKRIAAFASNRILLRDGVPIAALEAGEVLGLQPEAVELTGVLERTLRIGSMAPALRPYYA